MTPKAKIRVGTSAAETVLPCCKVDKSAGCPWRGIRSCCACAVQRLLSAMSGAVVRDGTRGVAEDVLVLAATAAWLSSLPLGVVLNWSQRWAGLQMGGVLPQHQWVKKAPIGASELVIAYIIFLHVCFNI